MKISTVLDYIDSGHMALPEFQRGYVWNREQVKSLFQSLYRRHPVGGLLVWATDSKKATYRGSGKLATGTVKLLLDGQQRITSIYGVARGTPPKFFDGKKSAFTGLKFHLDEERFSFYKPQNMKDDPLWIDVTELMKNGQSGHEKIIETLASHASIGTSAVKYSGRISRLLGILDVDMYADEVTGEDKTIDVVVDIFNRVNSGGTKLSKGDLAIAKICSEWPDGRNLMRSKLDDWLNSGYKFTLDWLLRCTNTVLTGEANFRFLHDKSPEEVQEALKTASKYINYCLNLIGGRLGLDHDQVLGGRFGIPVMLRYLVKRNEKDMAPMTQAEQDKLLFWYVQQSMWGRFSGATEATIDQDIQAIEDGNGDLDNLLDQLRLHTGRLTVRPEQFSAWSRGSRFYPILYLLTRMGQSKDLSSGIPLKSSLLGKMNKLEVHHLFPKALLYNAKEFGFQKHEVNSISNFCFLTKESNLMISDTSPEEYFVAAEKQHPGILSSQWIPADPWLWKVENYREFLKARQILLANELNRLMASLLHGDNKWIEMDNEAHRPFAGHQMGKKYVGGLKDKEEEDAICALNNWMKFNGLPQGIVEYNLCDNDGGEIMAIIDIAWPKGIQQGLSDPVAILMNEDPSTIALASQFGFRCFMDIDNFKMHIMDSMVI